MTGNSVRRPLASGAHPARHWALFSLLALVLCVAARSGAADPPAASVPPTNLMPAEQVLEQWAAKTGGKAWDKIKNRVANGTVEIGLLRLSGPSTVYMSEPHFKYEVWEPKDGGVFERGCDGKTVWNMTTKGGPVVLGAEDRAAGLRESTLRPQIHWKTMFEKVETVAEEVFANRPCYRLLMTPAKGEGEPETWYFDRENFHRVQVAAFIKLGDKKFIRRTYYDDFRPVNDVLVPFSVIERICVPDKDDSTKERVMQQQVASYTSIQHNVRMAPSRFDLPAEVVAKMNEHVGGDSTDAKTAARITAPAAGNAAKTSKKNAPEMPGQP